MTRIASQDRQIVSMQRGGSSLDTWVMTPGSVDAFSMLPEHIRPEDLVTKRRPVSSRAAENLFWMGRYAERAENTVRLARLTLSYLSRDDAMPETFLGAIETLCVGRGLVPEEVAPPALSPRVFERGLIAALADTKDVPSVGFDVRALGHAAGQIRDRLSPAHWRLILAAGDDLFAELGEIEPASLTPADATRALEHLGTQLTAITGAQTDRMTRDDGWRLMTIGRQIERLSTMSVTIGMLFSGDAISSEEGFDLLLELFDSIITYRAHYQRRHETAALIDLLVMDPENPRSLTCAIEALKTTVGFLPVSPGQIPLDRFLDIEGRMASLVTLCERDEEGHYVRLIELTNHLYLLGRQLSDEITRRYFTHAQISTSVLA